MKQIIMTTIIFLFISYTAVAIENPGIQSPIGPPTAVPSAGQSGLVPSRPSTYGMAGNIVMTGNVGGGRHFRGFVPYGSSYYSDSYSSPIDDFLRRSAGDPLATDRNPGVYTPYYDPRRTVTSVYRGGQSGFVAPRVNPQGSVDTSASSFLSQAAGTPLSLRQRPLSTPPDELTRVLERQIKLNQAEILLKTRKDTDALVKEAKKSVEKEFLKPEPVFLLQPEKKTTESQPEQKKSAGDEQRDRYEQIRDQLLEEVEQQEMKKGSEKTALTTEESEQMMGESVPTTEESAPIIRDFLADEMTADSAQETGLKGEYKTFASLAEARASEYMIAAQQFLKEKKFYKAADSFALAAVWQPEDAATHAGHVVSLFAAGEYMSSAYYLNQALIMRPELAEKKINLPVLIPDRDTFEDRIIEIKTWQERSQSGTLAFLMAYMLWQDGKITRAQDAITIARTLIPYDEAIKKLAKVIHPTMPEPEIPTTRGKALEPEQTANTVTDVVKEMTGEPNQP